MSRKYINESAKNYLYALKPFFKVFKMQKFAKKLPFFNTFLLLFIRIGGHKIEIKLIF